LTPKDRKYLLGELDYRTAQGERDRGQGIRNRVRAGLLDLELLFRHLDSHDRELIFTKPLPFRPPSLHQQYAAGIVDAEGDTRLVEATEYAFAFLYAGLRELDIDHEWELERALAHGEHDLLSSPFGIENLNVTRSPATP